MAKNDKRLDKLNTAIQAVRVTPAAEEQALALFRETGELPEHDALADAVVRRTLRLPRPKSFREILLEEAVSDFEPARIAARFVLRALVQSGQDVASRNFVDEDMEFPEFGSIGLYLMGWPEILVRPPYEAQATRVLRDHAVLRKRVKGSESMMRKLAEGMRDFLRSGDLPGDAQLRDIVITYAEFLALHAILGGEQDDILLAAFDWVGTADGEERERAIERLQSLVRHGKTP